MNGLSAIGCWLLAIGYRRLVVALAVLIAAATVSPVLAQDGVEDAAPAAIPGLAVVENEATVEFPERITFTLEAETDDPIDRKSVV